MLSTAEENRIQIFYVKTNSMAQIQKVIKEALDIAEVNENKPFTTLQKRHLMKQNQLLKSFAGAADVELTPQNTNKKNYSTNLLNSTILKVKSIGE